MRNTEPARKPRGFDTSIKLPGDYPWKILGWLTQELSEYIDKYDIGHDDHFDTFIKEISFIVRTRDTKGLLDLIDANGLPSIAHREITIPRGMVIHQLCSILSKYLFDGDAQKRRDCARETFLEAEARCKQFNLTGWKALANSTDEWERRAFRHAYLFIDRLLLVTLPDKNVLTEWSRHGPGASLGMVRGQTCAYHKYISWPYTTTAGALGYGLSALHNDERWMGALESSYREKHDIPMYALLDWTKFTSSTFTAVEGNRITFVPKNARTDRSIAIEPTINLFLQLGVDGYIRGRLKRFFVDLDDQTKNQVLARLGSRTSSDDESGYVTLDLKGASDSISTGLVACLFPGEWYNYLMALRSPCGEIDKVGLISYEKLSSMGNGYTFCVESAIFTALVRGAMLADGHEHFTDRDYAVYGDDIIIRRKYLPGVMRMLTLAGFVVNLKKTFTKGPIRESCGTDWFQGVPIRPMYISQLPKDIHSLWSDINRLKRMMSLRYGITQSMTVSRMEKWIPEQFRNFTGPCSDTAFDSYLHTLRPGRHDRNGLWKYRVLVRRAVRLPMKEFLLGRLVHSLRQFDPRPFSAESGEGSRFVATHRKMLATARSYSTALCWQSEYSDYSTLPYQFKH